MENEITLAWYGNHINIIEIKYKKIGASWFSEETEIERIKSIDHGGPLTFAAARARLAELEELPEYSEKIKRAIENARKYTVVID